MDVKQHEMGKTRTFRIHPHSSSKGVLQSHSFTRLHRLALRPRNSGAGDVSEKQLSLSFSPVSVQPFSFGAGGGGGVGGGEWGGGGIHAENVRQALINL